MSILYVAFGVKDPVVHKPENARFQVLICNCRPPSSSSRVMVSTSVLGALMFGGAVMVFVNFDENPHFFYDMTMVYKADDPQRGPLAHLALPLTDPFLPAAWRRILPWRCWRSGRRCWRWRRVDAMLMAD